MKLHFASFKCPKCGKTWETEFHEKPKKGFWDYCQCKVCLQERLKGGGETRPLHEAFEFRKA
jgi:transposase-like protein